MSHYNTPLRTRRNGHTRHPLRLRRGAGGARTATTADIRAALQAMAQAEPSDAEQLAVQIEEDYQFAFVRRVLVAHLSVAPVTCAALDETDERAVELAAALLDLWQRHLSQTADAYGRGRAAFAIEWEFDAAWRVHRPKLHPIPFGQSTPTWDSETGDFLGIEIPGSKPPLLLGPGQCWHVPTDADAMHPHGRSRYLGAARAEYDRRCDLMRLWNTHIRKYALRGGVAYGPETYVGKDGAEHSLQESIQTAWRARDIGALMYLIGDRGQDGRYPVEFTEPPILDPPAPIDAALRESDIRVLRSQGLSELSVQQTGDLGSYALAVVHRLVTLSVVYELAGQWGGGFGRYVVAWASRYNLGRDDAISFETPRLTELPDSAVADLAKAIVQQPELSPVAAAVDLRRILEAGGVPVGDDFEDRLARAVAERRALASLGGSLSSDDSAAGAASFAESLLDQRLDPNAVPAGVPDLESFWIDAQREIDGLFDEIARMLADRPDLAFHPTPAFRELLERADQLIEDARAAANLIGRAAVPVPPAPVRLAGPASVALDNPVTDRKPGWRWPWMDSLTDWLARRRLLTPDEFRAMPTRDRPRAVSIPSVSSPETLRKLQAKLGEAIAEGLPPREFRERVREIAAVPKHEAETLVRTATKQGYLQGKRETVEKPHVTAAFPFMLLLTARDTRVRDTHKPLDGLIVKVGSAAYRRAMELMEEYQCRCDAISLTEARARSEASRPGRRLVDDLPAEAAPAT